MIAEPPASPAMTYEPRGGALELFRCREREVVYVGPAGTGKTRAVMEKLFLAAMKHPKMRALIVRKTRASLTESALVTFESKVVDKRQLVAQDVRRQFRHSYEFKNGSSIVLGGMDNADRIMSTEFDMILVIEATEISEDDLEKLHTRLRNAVMTYQQLIAECNPSGPAHWLKRRIDTGKAKEILSRHADNPSVSPEYLEALSKLSGHRRARLYLGQWAAAEGLVYDTFDRAHNVIDAMPEGWESWQKVRAIDFGYTNPAAIIHVERDYDDNYWVTKEWYKTQKTEQQIAEYISACNFNAVYPDPENPSAIKVLEDKRVNVREVIKGRDSIQSGISKMKDLFKQGKLRIHKNCTNLISELEMYSYDEDSEKPIDEDNHAIDALRYVVMMSSTVLPQDNEDFALYTTRYT